MSGVRAAFFAGHPWPARSASARCAILLRASDAAMHTSDIRPSVASNFEQLFSS